MRLLLDTHVWLWLQVSPERLGARAFEAVSSTANELVLSAASAWEIAIKYRLGKLPLPEPPARYVPERVLRHGVTWLPIAPHHALAVADLPELHGDPFDRLLVAQAMAEGLTLVTADGALAAYGVAILAA